MEPKTFRILSLDGGGIMGAFSAAVLATFEKVTGWRIVEHFDLITGTSTGGIIAIGLAMGAGAQRSAHSTRLADRRSSRPAGGWEAGSACCGTWSDPSSRPRQSARRSSRSSATDRSRKRKRGWLSRPTTRRWVGSTSSRHRTTVLQVRPRPACGGRGIGHLGRAGVLPRPPHPRPRNILDGGVWANCPAMIVFVKAVDFLGQAPEQIRLLSLSTTGYPFRIGQQQFGGLLGWSTKIIETLLFGQVQATPAEVSCLLRHGLFHRIDYLTEPRLYHMDNASCVQQLLTIGRNTAELNKHMSVVQKEFLNGATIEQFQLK